VVDPFANWAAQRLFYLVTSHLSEGSFVRNGVVQIPKFDATSLTPTSTLILCLYV